ncbi:hypothetical protein [Streptomyces sp. S.PNR 29]|uniref:hypothetical protein n=1 Tax=Streptomyces sp. S.PNR 29 TaxID=2973805 RepID=UPI0025AF7A23|nr:hypothetical protein [Streptomyces sp. S.PNR 29]MDN0199281.1 hypothetical protein [Streptomyces sp. S.PNR 29]
MAQVVPPSVTRRTVGIIADGVFKVLLAGVYLAGAAPLGRLLGVPAWLMVLSGAALLIGGGVEVSYVRRRPMRTYTWLMVAYDTGWVSTALAGLLMAWQGSSAGGEVWIGYQTAAPLVLAALLVAAAPSQPASGTRAKSPAG